MPRRPPRCTSGDKQDDCKGRVVHLLARDDQGHSRHKRHCNGIAPSQPAMPRRRQHTPSNMYVETSFTTWAYLTWSWWTDIHTGPSSPHPGKEPRDSSIPYGTPSPLTGSQTPSHLTADHTSLDPSSKTGTCATGSHQPTIPTPTAGRR